MFIDKKLITTNKSGFTLVELIVVISILAILGTIAFLSFGGYSASARDAKRSQNLDDIVKAMTIGQANGVGITSYVTTSAASLSGTTAAGGLAGQDKAVFTTTDYAGGDVNTTALGLKSTDYQDPSSSANYKIGVTTLAGGAFEVAATMEAVNGTKTTRVLGNFRSRTTDTVTITGTGANNTVTISSADIGKLKVSDTLAGTAVTAGTKISNISADGTTITLSAPAILNNGTMGLQTAEVVGLIGDSATKAPLKDGDTSIFPYILN